MEIAKLQDMVEVQRKDIAALTHKADKGSPSTEHAHSARESALLNQNVSLQERVEYLERDQVVNQREATELRQQVSKLQSQLFEAETRAQVAGEQHASREQVGSPVRKLEALAIRAEV